MKGIVLQAPWAPLVALGVKTFETRWFGPLDATLRPGDDLAIVLGKSPDSVWALPGDCEGKTEAGWVYGFVGDHQAGYCIRTTDEGTRGDVFMHLNVDGPQPDQLHYYTAGTVIAVVRYGGRLDVHEPPATLPPGDDAIVLRNGPDQLWISTRNGDTDVTDQLPYGEFSPGRVAWPLSNPRPLATPVPCPAREADGTRISMQGVFTLPAHVADAVAAELTNVRCSDCGHQYRVDTPADRTTDVRCPECQSVDVRMTGPGWVS